MRAPLLARVFATMLLSLAAFALGACPAAAQSPNTYTLKLFSADGGTTPVQTTTAPASAAACNVAPAVVPTGSPVVNPTGVEWDDPANAGKACHLDLAAFFGGLPPSVQFTATLTFTDAAGLTGADSNVTAPFVHQLPPAPLRNVRVVGGR